jgi:hypothetical protein
LIDVIFAHSRLNIHLFGVVKVRPQSFFPKSYNPNTQVMSRVLVYPFWRFNDRLATSTVTSNEVNWFLKGLVIRRVCHKRKK